MLDPYDQPVENGEIRDLTIERIGKRGDGLAFVDGLAVIVPGTAPGDTVTVRIDAFDHNCAFAEVMDR